MIDFKEHSNWSRINKLYYGEYKNNITVVVKRFENIQDLYYAQKDKIMRYACDYRFRSSPRWRIDESVVDAKFYTNDLELLEWLYTNFEVKAISTPDGEAHEALLDRTGVETNTIIREKLYYNNYVFKVSFDAMDSWFKLGHIKRQEISNQVADMQQWMTDNIEDIKTMSNKWSWYGAKNHYTNDEHSLMLLKMILPDELKLEITKVLTLETA